MKSAISFLLPVITASVLLLLPVPQGLSPQAWHFFAIFAATIVGLILEPLPGAVVSLAATVLIAVFSPYFLFSPAELEAPGFNMPVQAFKWAVTGFADATVWLIIGAFMFAAGYKKTRFGERLALILVKYLGKRTLTLGYAVTFADLALAPFTPSNTARSGGTIYPIIANLPPLYDSRPNSASARKIGSYLMWVAITATCITSSLFMTALAPNILSLGLIKKAVGLDISWAAWFVSFLPLGALLLLAMPLLVYWIYPPGVKYNEEVPRWAEQQLQALGSLSRKEILLLALVILALVLWIFATNWLVPAMAALLVIVLMLISGVLEWEDITGNKAAWNTFIWFATLVTLAAGLAKTGFIAWLGAKGGLLLQGSSPFTAIIILTIAFYLLHYLFASTTAHTMALLPAILAIGQAVPGINMQVLCLVLVTSLGLMGILTPYGTGPSPVYYGSGYLPARDYWRLGAIFGLLFLFLQLTIIYPWVNMLFG
ncbi:DASS family sodium-coupled anion symporter [Candidatus Tokpelaia sp.]|uniref:DASS family sodium-coupled anion symporter n=1 Tax=Candidatus Tokpelaia sp. TaxID=2233777 RepID=UPI00123BFEDE|nr:DASS family sodium-coupled anion symporter [Candidatus Tokpelaia sp.]KAA6405995.1 anion permease [Candidatus Tokpelaia sp.]